MHFEWGVSETPYLIHDTTKAPHITGSGVLPEVECLPCMIRVHLLQSKLGSVNTHLWGSPFYGNFPSMRDIVISVSKVT